LALAWILKMQDKLKIDIIPILGATDVSHLEDNVLSLDVKISDSELNELNALTGTELSGA
ncbi:MAG: aldo/keto reductase, partial [Thermoplasmataceae archaeon]